MQSLSSLASRINTSHQACEAATRSAVQHALECGAALIEAKATVPHGQWLPWLKANCPAVSERTAQKLMRLSREWPTLPESKTNRDSDLSLREAFRLLDDSDPFEALQSVLDELRPQVERAEARLDELLAIEPKDDVERAELLRALAEVSQDAGRKRNRIAIARLRADRHAAELLQAQ